MSVPLRHLDRLVPEDLLELEQIPSPHHPVTSERMPEIVKDDISDVLAFPREHRELCGYEQTMKYLLEDSPGLPKHFSLTIGKKQPPGTAQAPVAQQRQ